MKLTGKTKAKFLQLKGCRRNSTFFKKKGDMNFVRAGCQYSRKVRGMGLETARVLSVAADHRGIPHIRYELIFERQQQRFVDGPRMLSLDTFQRTYM